MLDRRRALMASAAERKWTAEEYASGNAPSGTVVLNGSSFPSRSFSGRKAVTQIVAPNVVAITGHQIEFNSGLVRLVMQNAIQFAQECVYNNSNLEVIDVKGSGSLMQSLCFSNNGKLSVLILRGSDAVCPTNTNSFNGSKSSAKPIHVYVPAALKASYEAAANWSTGVSDGSLVFHNLEGSVYEPLNWWRDVE